MRAAIEQTKRAAALGEVPVGAVICHEGKIIAQAHNEREITLDPSAHAEMLAMRRAAQALGRRRLDGCTLYVTLEPCPMCAGGAIMAGVDAIYYGAADPKAGCAGSVYALPEDAAFGAGIPCMGGLLKDECKALIDDFFSEKR